MNQAMTNNPLSATDATQTITFIINGEVISLNHLSAGTADAMPSLLNYLRNGLKLSGTKEGCAEGDCGACTVIMAELDKGDNLRFKAVNSCILFPAAINGKAILTVEYLQNGEELHPIQQEFVKQSASQCGFCTPGFVMSVAAAKFDENTDNSTNQQCNIIAGNLCRCTGYGPILKAMQNSLSESESEPAWMQQRFATLKTQLQSLRAQPAHAKQQRLAGTGQTSYLPKTTDELAEIYTQYPDAVLIAGCSDVGLWASKKLQNWAVTIHLNHIAELQIITENDTHYHIGAGVSLQNFLDFILPIYPNLASYLYRFASQQIRQSGTVGGNLANGSPIGDLPPLLIAMGASIHLRQADKVRSVLLQDFFIEYGKQDRATSEFVSHITLPKILADNPLANYLRTYKISKRFEQDISAISCGFNLTLQQEPIIGDIIDSITICYGGMAGIPKRARAAENYLRGKELTLENLTQASLLLPEDFAPLSDMRASAAYRMQVAQNLFLRYFYDVTGNSQQWQHLHQPSLNFGLDFMPNDTAPDIISAPNMENPLEHVGQMAVHDSAHLHVSGGADYTDDLPLIENTLHVALVTSHIAHGDISTIDMPDNLQYADASDILGANTLNPVWGDDPIFSDKLVQYVGQPIMAVMADSHDNARKLAKQVKVSLTEKPAILTIAQAMEQQSYIADPVHVQTGNAEDALKTCAHQLTGEFDIGGQDHFYLEGQIAYAVPQDDEMLVYSSTQHPSEIQHVVAGALNIPYHKVRVVLRRMGGGFGGKESQANLTAVVAALAAHKFKTPVKFRMDRDDDMIITGKRHAFKINYQVGFDADGLIKAMKVTHGVQCGFSYDLSLPVADRALCHADSAYFIENFDITSYRLKTHTVSNTAFRGFGGPQGMLGMERIIDHIAFYLQQDAVKIRLANLYDAKGKTANRATTHYQMPVEDNILHQLMPDLVQQADYQQRRAEIIRFNQQSPNIKRGIAINPVKFGISFNLTFLNQAGALVHIYQDGSVKINHGGTEMGQGLMIKCAQVAAEKLQIPLAQIQISATDTDKVPNTSATAASSGADLNGMAIADACDSLVTRLKQFLVTQTGCAEGDIIWQTGVIQAGTEKFTFAELIKQAYMARISLSSTGYYSTPKIKWDGKNFTGRPFYYFAYGASISEVAIDILSGELRQTRCDIIHDVGNSLNPAIDLGQIEGAYVQGMGWLTAEELCFDDKGVLKTHAPSTYKIPTSFDRPQQMNISLYNQGNQEATIYRSKAVGEPPIMLAISNFLAIQDAVASVADYQIYPDLQAPATPENILNAVNKMTSITKAKTDG